MSIHKQVLILLLKEPSGLETATFPMVLVVPKFFSLDVKWKHSLFYLLWTDFSCVLSSIVHIPEFECQPTLGNSVCELCGRGPHVYMQLPTCGWRSKVYNEDFPPIPLHLWFLSRVTHEVWTSHVGLLWMASELQESAHLYFSQSWG